MINNKENGKAIVLELKGDLLEMKYNGLYDHEEILKLNHLVFDAEENMKRYYKKEHAVENMKYYEDILKEVIVLSTIDLNKSQLEKYQTIVGTYSLISHIESPLYYLENIDLYNFTTEELMNISTVVANTPVAYLSMVCPILVLPSVQSSLKTSTEIYHTTLVDEMKLFSELLIEQVNKYKKIDKNEEDKTVIRQHKEVDSLLNITSEQGFSFLCSDNESELAWNNIDDKPNTLYLVNQLLSVRSEYGKVKEYMKK